MSMEKYLKAEHDFCKGKVFLNILCNIEVFILENYIGLISLKKEI
jgi:hypothetical protein